MSGMVKEKSDRRFLNRVLSDLRWEDSQVIFLHTGAFWALE